MLPDTYPETGIGLDAHPVFSLVPVVCLEDLCKNVWFDIAIEELECVLVLGVLAPELVGKGYELVGLPGNGHYGVLDAALGLRDAKVQLSLLLNIIELLLLFHLDDFILQLHHSLN